MKSCQHRGNHVEPSAAYRESWRSVRSRRTSRQFSHSEVRPARLHRRHHRPSIRVFRLFVYGIARAGVSAEFFPFAPALEGTLYAFTVFAFAFIARPIGSVVFMAIQRRFGRETKLAIAMVLLGFSTAGIAFLPGYASIGSASIVLLSYFGLVRELRSAVPGWIALSAGPQRSPYTARLVRHARATRRAGRLRHC